MIGWIRKRLGQDKPEVQQDVMKRGSLFSTHRTDDTPRSRVSEMTTALSDVWQNYLLKHAPRPVTTGTGDDDDSQGWNAIKSAYTMSQPNMSDALFQWFGTQSFIGHQACAILSQHWMVQKICLVPARDAIRNGFEIINEVGEDKLDDKVIAAYARYDKKFKLARHLLEFAFKGRKFGIRLAIPLIDSPDPDFYEKEFNPDAIRPGSFKGWIQVDPYWTAPQLDGDAASRPDLPAFYEPTWWQINGKRYHRSHICMFRTEAPDDILKPSYLYGGVPVPQKIMERVYAAERCGNEAPLLTLTKRLYTLQFDDVEAMMLNKEKFDQMMAFAGATQDNFGARIAGKDDIINQFDTSLADLWTTIEGEYGLACASGGVPVNKIMGTAAGGLSNEGAYDTSNYHEELESIQTHELTPMVERHHLLVKLSYIIPKFGDLGRAETTIAWNPLDATTAKEEAEINELNARADLALVQTGAISDADVNARLRNSKTSGYSTIRPIEEGEREPDGGENDDLPLGTPAQPKGDSNGAPAN